MKPNEFGDQTIILFKFNDDLVFWYAKILYIDKSKQTIYEKINIYINQSYVRIIIELNKMKTPVLINTYYKLIVILIKLIFTMNDLIIRSTRERKFIKLYLNMIMSCIAMISVYRRTC